MGWWLWIGNRHQFKHSGGTESMEVFKVSFAESVNANECYSWQLVVNAHDCVWGR
ncbi:hypothetical protein NtRootA1_39900 [Arthrobacter sp. NtRootA1]|nr:hypothetical protein NtRootA1_39900 [Arthrobacter sp. NtRootA1]